MTKLRQISTKYDYHGKITAAKISWTRKYHGPERKRKLFLNVKHFPQRVGNSNSLFRSEQGISCKLLSQLEKMRQIRPEKPQSQGISKKFLSRFEKGKTPIWTQPDLTCAQRPRA
jgi:hypothetical protein